MKEARSSPPTRFEREHWADKRLISLWSALLRLASIRKQCSWLASLREEEEEGPFPKWRF